MIHFRTNGVPQWQYAARKISLIAFDRSLAERFKLQVIICGAERHPDFHAAALRLAQYAGRRGVILEILCC